MTEKYNNKTNDLNLKIQDTPKKYNNETNDLIVKIQHTQLEIDHVHAIEARFKSFINELKSKHLVEETDKISVVEGQLSEVYDSLEALTSKQHKFQSILTSELDKQRSILVSELDKQAEESNIKTVADPNITSQNGKESNIVVYQPFVLDSGKPNESKNSYQKLFEILKASEELSHQNLNIISQNDKSKQPVKENNVKTIAAPLGEAHEAVANSNITSQNVKESNIIVYQPSVLDSDKPIINVIPIICEEAKEYIWSENSINSSEIQSSLITELPSES